MPFVPGTISPALVSPAGKCWKPITHASSVSAAWRELNHQVISSSRVLGPLQYWLFSKIGGEERLKLIKTTRTLPQSNDEKNVSWKKHVNIRKSWTPWWFALQFLDYLKSQNQNQVDMVDPPVTITELASQHDRVRKREADIKAKRAKIQAFQGLPPVCLWF